MPSSCSRKCTCRGEPLARGGKEPSRVRTICPWASCTRRIRKISPVWRFSNLRKLSTIHPHLWPMRSENNFLRILSVGPSTRSKPSWFTRHSYKGASDRDLCRNAGYPLRWEPPTSNDRSFRPLVHHCGVTSQEPVSVMGKLILSEKGCFM